MSSDQQSFEFDASAPVDFLEQHGLRLTVDPPLKYCGRVARFVEDHRVAPGTDVQVVHVMSPHVGGEIRGYVLIGKHLHLRTPCSSGRWPEIDDAVGLRLDASVVPYIAENGEVWNQ